MQICATHPKLLQNHRKHFCDLIYAKNRLGHYFFLASGQTPPSQQMFGIHVPPPPWTELNLRFSLEFLKFTENVNSPELVQTGSNRQQNYVTLFGYSFPFIENVCPQLCLYLAIQGSSTPSKRAFSSGGITGTACHNCLSAEIFEALQILKSAYWNRHVAAVNQAAAYICIDHES